MAVASIQITQGATVGVAGQSVIGFDATTAITLTDDGGPGATSYLWEFVSFPGPLASAPAITNATSQVATVTPGPSLLDGVYLVMLTRTDPTDGVSTMVRFFSIGDEDGIALPSAGMNRNHTNVGGSALAQLAGWFGSVVGGTNVFLDAFLRLRKKREGRYTGRSRTVAHSAGTPVTDVLVYGASHSTQVLSTTGAGVYTIELDTAGAEDGATFRLHITSATGAGDVVLKNGIGGTTLYTLTAPGSSTTELGIRVYFDGTNWKVWPFSTGGGLENPQPLVDQIFNDTGVTGTTFTSTSGFTATSAGQMDLASTGGDTWLRSETGQVFVGGNDIDMYSATTWNAEADGVMTWFGSSTMAFESVDSLGITSASTITISSPGAGVATSQHLGDPLLWDLELWSEDVVAVSGTNLVNINSAKVWAAATTHVTTFVPNEDEVKRVEDDNAGAYRSVWYDGLGVLSRTRTISSTTTTDEYAGTYSLRSAGTVALRPSGASADSHIFDERWLIVNAAGGTPMRIGARLSGDAPFDTRANVYIGAAALAPTGINFSLQLGTNEAVYNLPVDGVHYWQIVNQNALEISNAGAYGVFKFYDVTAAVAGITLSVDTVGEAFFNAANCSAGLAFNAPAAGAISYKLGGGEALVISNPTGNQVKHAFRGLGADVVDFYADAANSSSWNYVAGSGTGFQITMAQRSGDVLEAAAFGIKGANASSTATTTARKRGGAVWLEAGRGTVPGIDPAGPIYIGLGNEVLGVTNIANGMVFGTGAAVGPLGSSDYRPFATEKGKISVRYDRLAFNVGLLVSETAANPIYLYSENLNSYVGVGNTGITMLVGGISVFDAATIGSVSVTATGTMQVQSTGGAAHLIAASTAIGSVNAGTIEFRSANRVGNFQNYSAVDTWLSLRGQGDIAIAATASTYTTLLTLVVTGATGTAPVTVAGIVHIYEAGGPTQKFRFEVTFRPDGSTGAMVGSPIIDVPEGDALGTIEIDAVGGCRIRFLSDASSVNAKTGRVTDLEYK